MQAPQRSEHRIVTGVFGGSFDPVHRGHLAVAEGALRHPGIDEVWLMVSPENPLKRGRLRAPESDRLEMARLAVANISDPFVRNGIKVSDFEFHLPRPSYTVETLRALSKAYPDRAFRWIVGGDNLEGLDSWRSPDEILRDFGLIVYPRPDSRLPEILPEGVEVLEGVAPFNESSTSIREALKSGAEAVTLPLPKGVAEYLSLHPRLYRW